MQNEESEACIASLTFQGFLFARQKLYKQAINSFTRACQQAQPGPDRDNLYTNLGYLYLKLGQPDQAVSAFDNVAHASFKPITGLALAYYRSGQSHESYATYSNLLASGVAQDDEKAATILVAMASLVYASQGETDTKTLLYQWYATNWSKVCILIESNLFLFTRIAYFSKMLPFKPFSRLMLWACCIEIMNLSRSLCQSYRSINSMRSIRLMCLT